MDESAVVTAYFDGLCEPRNPGGAACGGWYIDASMPIPGADLPMTGGRFYRAGAGATNNYAEYSAALDALRAIYRAGWRGRVVLRGDSKLVISQFSGAWECRAEGLRPLLEKLRHAATFFESVRLEWVPRDANAKADAASREAYARYCASRGGSRPS